MLFWTLPGKGEKKYPNPTTYFNQAIGTNLINKIEFAEQLKRGVHF